MLSNVEAMMLLAPENPLSYLELIISHQNHATQIQFYEYDHFVSLLFSLLLSCSLLGVITSISKGYMPSL
jgi:hypothetical protein